MTRFQYAVAGVVVAMWLVGYAYAFFIDRSAEGLATSITPVLLIVVGFIFGQHAINLLKGRRDE